MKIYTKTLTLLGLLFCSFISNGQNVNIPDPEFSKYLLRNTNINTDTDKANISKAEAENFTGQINVNNKNIQDLTGIEAFINISWLNCSNNSLSNLPISQNKKLTYLNFSNNNIEQINTSSLSQLTTLFCNNNKLKALDVKNNTFLRELNCSSNKFIKTLDIRNNTSINNLNCADNQLTSLMMGPRNNQIQLFACNNNQLPSLDVSQMINLRSFNCANNNLASLVFGNNRSISSLDCSNNQLETLKIPNLIGLKSFSCHTNKLNSLDLTNNTNILNLFCKKNNLSSLILDNLRKLSALSVEENILTSLDTKKNPNLSNLSCQKNRIKDLDLSLNKNLLIVNCGEDTHLSTVDIRNRIRVLQIFHAKQSPNLRCILVDDVAKFKNRFLNNVDNANIIVTACPAVVKVQSITVFGTGNVSTITTKGGTLKMDKMILPANATNKTVTWSVDKTAIATINATTGILKAVKDGVVTVKATAKDGSGKFGTKQITISNQNPPILVQTITVFGTGNVSTITTKGGTLKMDKTILPANATNKDVTWSVDKTTIATINATSGILTAVKDGVVTVKATAKDGSGKSGTKQITISNQNPPILVQTITVFGTGNVSTINTKGGTLKMDKTILPANATNKDVTWSVDKTTIATINATSGILTAVKDGIVTVTATAKDGSGKSGTKQIIISNQTSDPIVDIPDPKFRAYLISKDIIDTNKDDKIQVKEAEAYTGSIFINNLGVQNMKGIEAFKKIGQLFCKNNLFTTLDLRSNTLLKILDCENNKNLTTINITNSTDLRTLKFGECPKVESIDVTNAPQLRVLRTRRNIKITQLDISKNTLLQDLNILENGLKTLNIKNNTALQLLYASSNKLSALDISKNTKITTIDLSSNELKTLNTNTNTLVSSLNISGNPVAGRLDLSKNTRLRTLRSSDTELEAINLKNGKNVFLSKLDVTNNPKLKCLQVDDKADFIARLNADKKVDDNSIISETCFTDTAIKVDKVTIAGPDKIDTDKGEIKLTATVAPQNATNKELEWTIDKTSLATLTVKADHVLVKAKVDGVVTVKATAKDGSGKFATKEITITNQTVTSIIDVEHGFVLFPNPARDRLTIATDLAIQQIVITDLAGKTVKTFDTTKTLDIGDLNPNMYLLKVLTDNEVYVRKFIKE